MGNNQFFARLREMPPGPVHESEPLGCVKVGFESEAAAGRVGDRFGQKAYRCPVCQRWHLTKHRNFKWTDKGRRR